ncbi:POSSIBLE CONSERVED INTEGRAL MEMBRANE PROTEIN [Vagococcus fluvialis bH819]|uniref:POSSIBLE CONSERVED INTEGRAL MEMBRANE PROTEIN n=2 Tax=Enterococcaceae TaxID=81852 RepID=A0A1X6WSL4_9ENTE|nr:POSSIBLE CONSERVED INTEGRAL MEMBRANE PROTEIN [Vagococcus fluvialis bH819]
MGAISWFIAGCLWCVTIIGIPVGLQCFKIAGLSLWPFGKKVVYGTSSMSFLVNIIWLLVSGWVLALGHVISGILLCITIIGIPFGKQSFKLAQLALMPFGARVVSSNSYYMD